MRSGWRDHTARVAGHVGCLHGDAARARPAGHHAYVSTTTLVTIPKFTVDQWQITTTMPFPARSIPPYPITHTTRPRTQLVASRSFR